MSASTHTPFLSWVKQTRGEQISNACLAGIEQGVEPYAALGAALNSCPDRVSSIKAGKALAAERHTGSVWARQVPEGAVLLLDDEQ